MPVLHQMLTLFCFLISVLCVSPNICAMANEGNAEIELSYVLHSILVKPARIKHLMGRFFKSYTYLLETKKILPIQQFIKARSF